MSIVLDDRVLTTPFSSVCWIDDPKQAPRVETDRTRRTRALRAIVLHAVHGKLGPVRPGLKPSTRAAVYARYQARTSRKVSWDYTLDTDGTLVAQNDPATWFCWHATSANPVSLGIELVQDDDGALYDGQLKVLVQVIDFLTLHLAIQRQIPWTRIGLPPGVRPRLDEHGTVKGEDFVGVYAHYMLTTSRGAGDVTAPFEYLRRAGYEAYDLDAAEDLSIWKARQLGLGMARADQDGVPLGRTVAALRRGVRPTGLWVARPGDP